MLLPTFLHTHRYIFLLTQSCCRNLSPSMWPDAAVHLWLSQVEKSSGRKRSLAETSRNVMTSLSNTPKRQKQDFSVHQDDEIPDGNIIITPRQSHPLDSAPPILPRRRNSSQASSASRDNVSSRGSKRKRSNSPTKQLLNEAQYEELVSSASVSSR